MSDDKEVEKQKQLLKTSVVIIGSGPAGYTAGVYLARADLAPIMFEGSSSRAGGQLMTTTDIENFPGFPDGINGYDLMERIKQQAIKFGLICYTENVLSINTLGRLFILESTNYTVEATSVIIATGATANKLTFENSDKFWGLGISACAVCDGACPIFRHKPIVVVGGGDSAMEEATFLTKFASKVYIIYRGEKHKLRASKYMLQKAINNPKIKFIYSSTIYKAHGNSTLESIDIINDSGYITNIECAGLFYAIGHKPETSIFKNMENLAFDEKSYILTLPGTTKTSINGLFACGDVQDSRYRQAITACGTGCMAALDVEKYLSTL